MQITLTSFNPYDGTYPMDVDFSTREQGWVKRFSGYLPLEYGRASGDAEFAATLIVIALHRAGRIDKSDAEAVFERLQDVRLEQIVKIDFDDEEAVEDDAGPPAVSSNGSENTSGPASKTSSGTSAPTPSGSGMPGLAISQSGPPMLEN